MINKFKAIDYYRPQKNMQTSSETFFEYFLKIALEITLKSTLGFIAKIGVFSTKL